MSGLNKAVQYKLYEPRDISGLVLKDNLNYNFMLEPQKATKFAINLKKYNTGIDLNVILDKYPIKYFKDENDIVWDLVSGNQKVVPLIKAQMTLGTDISATSLTGLSNGEFYLFFPENRFWATHIIGGEENEKYSIYVIENGVQIGASYRYKCRLEHGDPELYIPYEELTAGKKFSIIGAASESSLSDRGVKPTHDFPYKMLTNMSSFRMQDEMPGNLANRNPVSIYWKDEATGKTMTNWLDKWSYDFEMEFQRLKNYLFYYSVSNRAEDGTFQSVGPRGHVIKRGPGLKQQMESSHYFTFNSFDIDKFVELLTDVSVNKYAMTERGVLVHTGNYGAIEFNKALESRAQYFTPVRDDSRIYSTSAQAGIGKAMGFGGQFVEYWGPNGCKVSIVIDPTYDDPILNKKTHPTKAGVLRSYDYDIFNLGTASGEPNIQKIMLENGGSEIRRYIPGLRSPFELGNTDPKLAVSPVDGWEQHFMFIGGLMMLDPSRALNYRLNVV